MSGVWPHGEAHQNDPRQKIHKNLFAHRLSPLLRGLEIILKILSKAANGVNVFQQKGAENPSVHPSTGANGRDLEILHDFPFAESPILVELDGDGYGRRGTFPVDICRSQRFSNCTKHSQARWDLRFKPDSESKARHSSSLMNPTSPSCAACRVLRASSSKTTEA